jgi:ankyrin repeat protein
MSRSLFIVLFQFGIITIFQSWICYAAPIKDCDVLVAKIKSSEFSSVQSALQNGINPNCKIKYGLSPLMIACSQGKLDFIELLLEHGANVNQVSDFGHSALVRAVEGRNLEVVRLLLDSGADVQRFGGDAVGAAAVLGRSDILKLLLEHQAQINTKSENGMTPLMLAAWDGDVESIRVLLAAGANVNARDSKGR